MWIGSAPEPADDRRAVLRVRAERGGTLRRRALPPEDGEPDPVGEDPAGEGWEILRVRVGDALQLAQEVAGYGSDVVLLEPPDVRDEVVRRLLGAAAAHQAPVPAGGGG